MRMKGAKCLVLIRSTWNGLGDVEVKNPSSHYDSFFVSIHDLPTKSQLVILGPWILCPIQVVLHIIPNNGRIKASQPWECHGTDRCLRPAMSHCQILRYNLGFYSSSANLGSLISNDQATWRMSNGALHSSRHSGSPKNAYGGSADISPEDESFHPDLYHTPLVVFRTEHGWSAHGYLLNYWSVERLSIAHHRV